MVGRPGGRVSETGLSVAPRTAPGMHHLLTGVGHPTNTCRKGELSAALFRTMACMVLMPCQPMDGCVSPANKPVKGWDWSNGARPSLSSASPKLRCTSALHQSSPTYIKLPRPSRARGRPDQGRELVGEWVNQGRECNERRGSSSAIKVVTVMMHSCIPIPRGRRLVYGMYCTHNAILCGIWLCCAGGRGPSVYTYVLPWSPPARCARST